MSAHGDFSRQSFLGAQAEEILAHARVAIVGLGGGGSHIAQQLAHLGVGHFRLVDPQAIEASNLNRLVGATADDVANTTPKVQILKRLIKGIRPWATVRAVQAEWQTASDELKDTHTIFGCLDGYQQRLNLERATRRFGLPYIDIGMDVTLLSDGTHAVAGQMIRTIPGGPCMSCLGFLTQERLNREENDYGDAGMNPQVVWTNGTLASLAVGAFAQLATPWFNSSNTYEWLELDGNSQSVFPSRQPHFANLRPCNHFTPTEVGDPFFDIRNIS